MSIPMNMAQLEIESQTLTMIVVGSVMFALAGVIFGSTPLARAAQRTLVAASACHPAVMRIARAVGLASFPAAALVMVLSSSFPAQSGDPFAALSAGLFAVGVLGVVIGQSAELQRASARPSVRPSSAVNQPQALALGDRPESSGGAKGSVPTSRAA